ncbi:MoaF C-terminal domain-containing protein [Variovorax terrae]|uniref:Molybdenum cofactor biosynthesis F family protein n=1 Tax=Variovorax terrae TaxID=2923278 RepID=A0A9X2AQ54_9BURK|nr:MoaF C-terminal domain-containing protein [Variovorax terrae]MCJ0766009.1 molybdenum cofactor biosynthesis F family protein [Variovorax terrae]
MAQNAPAGWKNYEDFAAGIDTNRLPPSAALVGQPLLFALPGSELALDIEGPNRVGWSWRGERGHDWCEVIEVAPQTWFVDMTFEQRSLEALTLVFNSATRRALAVPARVRSAEEAGAEPRVAQEFLVGTLGRDASAASGLVPHPSRDLIGLRTLQTYSPHHVYEHTYLSSTRYAWQCLKGEQRGHGDVDLSTVFQFAENQYLFTFREFIIPVASTFFFNFDTLRSTGKFLGVTGAGCVANNPAGAFIHELSRSVYPDGIQPA